MLIVADGATKYSLSYDQSTLANLTNKTTQIANLTDQIKDNTSSLASQDSVFDIVGSLFSKGYNAFKTSFAALDLFGEMTSDGVQQLNLGSAGSVVTSMIIAVVSILVIIGIIMAIIVKWQT